MHVIATADQLKRTSAVPNVFDCLIYVQLVRQLVVQGTACDSVMQLGMPVYELLSASLMHVLVACSCLVISIVVPPQQLHHVF